MCGQAQIEDGKSFRRIHTNTSVLARLPQQATRNAVPAWFYAMKKLTPKPGPQVVDFTEAPRRLRNALPHLVEAGFLRPFRGSAMKFYLPRKLAYATVEQADSVGQAFGHSGPASN